MFKRLKYWKQRRYVQALVRRGLRLGQNVFLNDGFFLDPMHCALITLEDDVTFGPGVRVFAHDASSKRVIGKARVGLVHVKRNAFIGAGSILLPGATIGENSILAAGSTLGGTVPDNEIWGGSPAKKIMTFEEYRARAAEKNLPEFSESIFHGGEQNAEALDELRRALEVSGTAFLTGAVAARGPGYFSGA